MSEEKNNTTSTVSEDRIIINREKLRELLGIEELEKNIGELYDKDMLTTQFLDKVFVEHGNRVEIHTDNIEELEEKEKKNTIYRIQRGERLWKKFEEWDIDSDVNEMIQTLKQHQEQIAELKHQYNLNEERAMCTNEQITSLKQKFIDSCVNKERHERLHKNSFRELRKIKSVLKELANFTNMIWELLLNAGIIDEVNHQRGYKEFKKDVLDKLEGSEKEVVRDTSVVSASHSDPNNNTDSKEPCPLCAGEKLEEINEIEDKEKRYYELQDFINKLLNKEKEPSDDLKEYKLTNGKVTEFNAGFVEGLNKAKEIIRRKNLLLKSYKEKEPSDEKKEFETGWIDDVFSDFLKDSTYHLEENLPHLAEVLAENCWEFVEKPLIGKFLDNINAWLNGDISNYEIGDPEIEYWIDKYKEWEKRRES